ncbi:MAG: ASKHA domain-containing protein [Deltaproteobacteria bacterium]|nr:ASKHA domain-containing protein [Deltaproteobacteria bacterium]
MKVKVLPEGLRLKVRWGTTILEALQEADVRVEGECGGLGKCGMCKVRVLSKTGPLSKEEKELLDEAEIEEGIRLACRNRVVRDLVIQLEEMDSDGLDHQILAAGSRSVFQLDPLIDERSISLKQSPQERGLYGLTFDLGTTTLVGKLISLADGREVAAASRLNSQSKYGADIISRIQHVKEQPAGLKDLNHLIIQDLNQITEQLLETGKLEAGNICIGVAAGNTTMQHLFLGLDPTSIAHAPFTPLTTDGLILKTADLGITLHPEALVYVMPARSGYVGGDLISMILASGCAEQDDKIALGLDLGTNGEIFLGNRKRLMTCSAAAGPALEGARISHGMIAKEGAIESVYVEGDNLRYQVIGNVEPKGICGSGLVDLVAVLLDRSIIDQGGLLQPPQGGSEDTLTRVIQRDEGVYDFLVATPEESFSQKRIYLSQKDVRELQLAKGAVAAGIQILMDEMSFGIRDIDVVYLAGAFGNYIHPQSALRIGLIPKVDPKIIYTIGNAASTGASMVLLAKGYWKMANDLARSIEHVELSTRPDFNEYFIENLNFPQE